MKLHWGLVLSLSLAMVNASALAVPCADEIVEFIAKHAFDRRLADSHYLNAEQISKMDVREFNEYLSDVDIYASYVPAENVQRIAQMFKGTSAGIGMDIIRDRDEKVRCLPFPNSPADLGGVLYGDILLAVDGLVVDSMDLVQVASLIRGEKDTEVVLTLLTENDEVYELSLNRSITNYPTVVRTTKNPAVIKILRFGPNTVAELEQELKKFAQEEGSDKRRLFIDLRGNTGGFLEQAYRALSLFLPKGAWAYSYADDSGITRHVVEDDRQIIKRRVVLMQDEFTASSAEMFIVALKSGAIVGTYGTQSTGKALVQNIFRLSDGSVLKFSVGQLLDPAAKSWQNTGLTPDVKKPAPKATSPSAK